MTSRPRPGAAIGRASLLTAPPPRRRRVRRWPILLLIGLGLCLCLGAALRGSRPAVVFNASPSLPRGLYWVRPATALSPGDIVAVELPAPWRRLAARRGYLPDGLPLIKRVAATAGARVCAAAGRLHIDGQNRPLPQRAADGSGRRLPAWSGCRRLRRGEIFLLAEHPASFDGRYFGPVPQTAVIGKAVLLWPS